MKIFRKGFNYSQDGPGNRLVYHMQGCTFRCKWCANPESMPLSSPQCEERSVEELLQEIRSCKMMFFGGGGVTFSGGEPTVQFEELYELLRKLREEGIHTAIETNGAHPQLERLLPFVDFLMMDWKHYDEEKHRFWTGASGAVTRENLEKICASGRQALIRIPLVRGVNLEAEGFAEYLARLDCRAVSFEFLSYHEFGKNKWTQPYEITNGFVTAQDVRRFRDVFAQRGLRVVST